MGTVQASSRSPKINTEVLVHAGAVARVNDGAEQQAAQVTLLYYQLAAQQRTQQPRHPAAQEATYMQRRQPTWQAAQQGHTQPAAQAAPHSQAKEQAPAQPAPPAVFITDNGTFMSRTVTQGYMTKVMVDALDEEVQLIQQSWPSAIRGR